MNTMTPAGNKLIEDIISTHDKVTLATMIPTPRRLVDIIGANRPWLTFAQCMEIAQDVHAELIAAASNR